MLREETRTKLVAFLATLDPDCHHALILRRFIRLTKLPIHPKYREDIVSEVREQLVRLGHEPKELE